MKNAITPIQNATIRDLYDAASSDPLVYSFLALHTRGELSQDDCLINLVKAMAERHEKTMQLAVNVVSRYCATHA